MSMIVVVQDSHKVNYVQTEKSPDDQRKVMEYTAFIWAAQIEQSILAGNKIYWPRNNYLLLKTSSTLQWQHFDTSKES